MNLVISGLHVYGDTQAPSSDDCGGNAAPGIMNAQRRHGDLPLCMYLLWFGSSCILLMLLDGLCVCVFLGDDRGDDNCKHSTNAEALVTAWCTE